ncbi:MAG: hypothetical protein PHQ15_11980 [Methanosarcina sp.]|nr:hypothetical protein [Methanosarcina sp.]
MIVIFLTNPTSAIVVSGNTHLGVEVSEISPNPARPGEELQTIRQKAPRSLA